MTATRFVHLIYLLCEPGGEIRYVGKSVRPQVRLQAHLAEARSGRGDCHRLRWLRRLLANGQWPELIVVARCTDDEWQEMERIWISGLRAEGARLVNDCDGGEGRHGPLSQQTRDRISFALQGRAVNPAGESLTDSHKAAISRSLIGNRYAQGKHWTLSEETRERQRAFACSEEGRRIRSAAARKRWAAAKAGVAL